MALLLSRSSPDLSVTTQTQREAACCQTRKIPPVFTNCPSSISFGDVTRQGLTPSKQRALGRSSGGLVVVFLCKQRHRGGKK